MHRTLFAGDPAAALAAAGTAASVDHASDVLGDAHPEAAAAATDEEPMSLSVEGTAVPPVAVVKAGDTVEVTDSPVTDGARASLESMLSRKLRVEISDGRVIYGRLVCTDSDLNLILCGSEEHGPTQCTAAAGDAATSVSAFRRHLGMVMVPGKHIVSAALEAVT